jgi:hypothetical protein
MNDGTIITNITYPQPFMRRLPRLVNEAFSDCGSVTITVRLRIGRKKEGSSLTTVSMIPITTVILTVSTVLQLRVPRPTFYFAAAPQIRRFSFERYFAVCRSSMFVDDDLPHCPDLSCPPKVTAAQYCTIRHSKLHRAITTIACC